MAKNVMGGDGADGGDFNISLIVTKVLKKVPGVRRIVS